MATIDELKAKLAEQEKQLDALRPAVEAAKQNYSAAQSALDAYYATPGRLTIGALSRARQAAEADPTNANLQQQYKSAQETWDQQKQTFQPLLQAREAAAAEVAKANGPYYEVDNQAAQTELEIAKIDPSQASPEAVQRLQETGEYKVPASTDPGIPQTATTATQTPAATAATPVNLAADPNTNLGAEGQAATDAPAAVNTEDPFEAARLAAEQAQNEQPTEADLNVGPEDPEAANLLEQAQEINRAQLATEATDVEPGPGIGQVARDAGPSFGELPEDERISVAGDAAQVGKQLAQQQAARRAAENVPSQADWRVRISLAQGSNYLYNFGDKDSAAGLLAPLRATNGVIFPYTPTIETSYHAKYNTSDLVHSNYRGYFYQNSYVDQLTVKGTFTAQDTKEAQYLLAVIHFFRTVTKMFYGATDQYAGTPPPLVFLSGFGPYQFNNHPCLVTNFNYTLPNDVDYIRTQGFNNFNINMENRRTVATGAIPGGILAGSFSLAAKLGINKLFAGGIQTPANQSTVRQQVDKDKAANSTYVPTKMEISVTLLPTQTRQQVSQQFSVKEFANGNLLKRGFW